MLIGIEFAGIGNPTLGTLYRTYKLIVQHESQAVWMEYVA